MYIYYHFLLINLTIWLKNNYLIEKSKNLLKNPNMSLLDVAVSVGFNSQNYYSSVFKKITNKTPLEYKQEIKL